MNDVRATVAKNITELRLLNNMTQTELGERLNYSDKTVSKWERGESVPDIAVLAELSQIFGVSLDYLAGLEVTDAPREREEQRETRYNRRVISYISESLVWLIAVFAYIITSLVARNASFQWLYFVYALPIVLIVKLVFNSVWFNVRHNYYIISALIWSILATIHVTFRHFGINVSLVYLLGIAGQIVVILWSFIKKPRRSTPRRASADR